MNSLLVIQSLKRSILPVLTCISIGAMAQTCPNTVPVTINTNPNTYYPGLNNPLNAGASSITLGAASSGTTPIASGDLLLLIQMQGGQINSTNDNSYGDGVAGGLSAGYLNNSELLVGNMEYVVATSAVPLAGGTLSILNPTTKNYKSAAFGTDGQYRFQVIRVGVYYDLTLGGTITAQAWNGSTGGVVILNVTNNLNFSGQTITAARAGFRGGAGRQLSGGTGGLSTDQVTLSTNNFNASKGEGLAGTPRYINDNGTLLDNGAANEGYAGGSFASGAPGNAGGGGTDGRPSANDQNSGGGGGANGGVGGRGGNSWQSNLATGGYGGEKFLELTPSRIVMGGGGGAGTTNDGTGTPGAGFASSGAAGGGMVIITARTISGNGTIDVSGGNAYTTVLNDGTGGGGAGGSVVIYANSGHSGVTVLANGGNGGTNAGGSTPPEHGPGGGGGGGAVYSNMALNGASTVAGGDAGRTTAGNLYNATAGNGGVLVQNVNAADLLPQLMNCSVLQSEFNRVAVKRQHKNSTDQNSVFSMAISPNPVRGSNASIRFNLESRTAEPVQLRMVNLNGVVLWKKSFNTREGENIVSIDNLSAVVNGTYFIQYHDGSKAVSSQIVVSR
jgi:hypothetical protein